VADGSKPKAKNDRPDDETIIETIKGMSEAMSENDTVRIVHDGKTTYVSYTEKGRRSKVHVPIKGYLRNILPGQVIVLLTNPVLNVRCNSTWERNPRTRIWKKEPTFPKVKMLGNW
jgi:hypothetical protein